MKKLILIIFIGLYCDVFDINAQQVVSLPQKTQVEEPRFEILQFGSSAYLLDKYTGRVWWREYEFFVEVLREQKDTTSTNQVNYQLNISGHGSPRFLLNVHTGDTWKLDENKRKFVKVVTP